MHIFKYHGWTFHFSANYYPEFDVTQYTVYLLAPEFVTPSSFYSAAFDLHTMFLLARRMLYKIDNY